MLGNKARKSLREQKWHDYINQYKNPSDTWSDIRSAVNNGIGDLHLLTNLPKEKQEILFTSDNINKIIRCLFSINISNSKKIEIAELLANYGIKVLKEENENLFQDTPDIAKLTSANLDQTIKICNDISYKSITTALENRAQEKGQIYVLNWHKAFDRDKKRFDNFISTLIGESVETIDLRYERNKANIRGRLKNYEKTKSPYFDIQIYPYDHNVVLTISDVRIIKGARPKEGAIIEKDGELKYTKKVKIDFENNEFLLYKR